MLKCIEKINKTDIIQYRKQHNLHTRYYEMNIISGEDTFFMHALEIFGYTLPSKEDCIQFCENLCDHGHFNKKAFGIHNIKHKLLTFVYKDITDMCQKNITTQT